MEYIALARIIQRSAVSAPQQADGMKRRKSDSVVARKTAKPASVNPFEVRVNRKKHDILGQKTKSDRGLPGISRSKAVKKVILSVLLTFSVCITEVVIGPAGSSIKQHYNHIAITNSEL